MSKLEAKGRIERGEYTWDDLRKLMELTHPILTGEIGKTASRVNQGMSLATTFNIHWRGLKGKSGPLKFPGDDLQARNIIRDFGESRIVPRKKPVVHVHHEELMEIE